MQRSCTKKQSKKTSKSHLIHSSECSSAYALLVLAVYCIVLYREDPLISHDFTLHIILYREDPLISLNYAVFLHNTGELSDAKKKYRLYDKKRRAQKSANLDPEVRE